MNSNFDEKESFNFDNVKVVSEYLKFSPKQLRGQTPKQQIKEICVKKLCSIVGITGNFNCENVFFDFFSSIMGEAVCEKLCIKEAIACDELRLIRYENINLVRAFENYLNEESLDEAFLDGFLLADRYRFVIDKIKQRYC